MAWAQLPSEALKNIRFRLAITTPEVADFSQKIAQAEGNPNFTFRTHGSRTLKTPIQYPAFSS
jgi:hypothetical protein